MKIGIHVNILPSTVFINRLIEALVENGQQVVVFGTAIRGYKYITGAQYVAFNLYSAYNFSKLFFFFKYFLLLKVFKRNDKKQLDIFLRKNNSFTRHNQARYYPILWHKPDVLHIQWVRGIEQYLWAQEFGIKLIASLRGTNIYMNPILEQEVAAGYRAAFPKLNGVHGVCADVLREAEYYGLNISKSKVIHSGLHLDEFEFIPREKKDKTSKLYFISVGRQSWMKGYHYALDALAEIKRAGFDFEYLIIGGGSSEELLFQITDLGLQDYIKLLDWTPFEEVKKAIQISDVLLLPSVSEGIANTAIEAMALGTVVIASDCGGMKELIQNKVNGFLVPSRNPRMIADTILKWVKMPDDLKYRISQNARQTVEDKFNAKGMASSFIELYQTMEVN